MAHSRLPFRPGHPPFTVKTWAPVWLMEKKQKHTSAFWNALVPRTHFAPWCNTSVMCWAAAGLSALISPGGFIQPTSVWGGCVILLWILTYRTAGCFFNSSRLWELKTDGRKEPPPNDFVTQREAVESREAPAACKKSLTWGAGVGARLVSLGAASRGFSSPCSFCALVCVNTFFFFSPVDFE